mmetsp:Transcript_3212/g.3809  ORF Transcript_3212/g.3809 Transcript_3212/m.3809 type:complete len:358 (+) Transcript_3212:53-1126(+)
MSLWDFFGKVLLWWNGRPILHFDNIYGVFLLCNPQICRLIRSQGVQRLASVTQAGTPSLTGWIKPVYRLDHMIGAMLLVRQAGGSIDEQIAALLHDVTHTAFSHVVDIVYMEELGGKSFHEQNVLNRVRRTDIPSILGKGWEEYFKEENFPLLEQPSPNLCADRGDYSPRDAVAFGESTNGFTKQYFLSITSINNRLAITSNDIAKEFCLMTLHTNRNFYNHPKGVGLYYCSAAALRRAVKMNLLSEYDFETKSCRQVWKILHSIRDPEIEKYLKMIEEDRMKKLSDSVFKLVPVGSHKLGKEAQLLASSARIRPRFVDPLVKTGESSAERLSDLDEEVKHLLASLETYYVDVYYVG